MFIQPMNGMHLVGQINGLDGFKGKSREIGRASCRERV